MVRTVDVDGSFLLARSVRRIDLQYKFHFDQSHKSPTQVRVWPNLDEYLDRKQSSLIQNGAFGFNPFHGGLGFASFPAAICSVMTVLWWSYPSWRLAYVACVAAVAI